MPNPHSTSELPPCALLVMSCDAYRDLWTPFFTLFRRFWPDCPFPVYLASNQAIYQDSSILTLTVGDHSWSHMLRLCLQQLDVTYILLLLEDFFLDQPVASRLIMHNLQTLHLLNGTELRLFPHPGPDSPLAEHPGIGCLKPAAPYRVSAQAALWNRTALITLLRDNESAWDFEWNGTARARGQADGFYSSYSPSLSYRQVVERGQWFRSAAKYYAGQNIGCDFAARPVMSPPTALKKAINRLGRNSIQSLARMRASLL